MKENDHIYQVKEYNVRDSSSTVPATHVAAALPLQQLHCNLYLSTQYHNRRSTMSLIQHHHYSILQCSY